MAKNDILVNLRKNMHLTQEDVAQFLGISKAAYSRYENGKRKLSMETLQKLSLLFLVDPNAFFLDSYAKLVGATINESMAKIWKAAYQSFCKIEDSEKVSEADLLITLILYYFRYVAHGKPNRKELESFLNELNEKCLENMKRAKE